ncbi:LytTR family DNA-binding domain-containing protein [Haloplasma contractile]|uniref:Sensory transduction protein LytT n=1 Tax=Haloplasma contractile SSD-17B TaxID=1033810 RepID=F7Q0R3_9MOLU|nr:LytTR family DNA-binding domain-containing protein [Haloplasma contractile]ERJ11973.1 Sensory transduction protein LytT [Haloplasma contractile SSD-17B]
MKVKIICRKENYDHYEKMLTVGGFTISEDAALIFKEENYQQDSIAGMYNNRYELIHYPDIVYIESFGHDIMLHTRDKEYSIKEKLYEIEGLFENKGFVRINRSCVVNKKQIKEIIPTFNTKFILTMRNNQKVEVTRSYYTKFKEYIGL